MGEDMTYTAVTDWRKRAQELEAALREQCTLDMTLIAQRAELERENAELRARLDAVPVDALHIMVFGDSAESDFIPSVHTVAHWVSSLLPTPAPDDTDAPLKLAAIDDDDGDL